MTFLPDNGRLGGSGSGQPSSETNPSLSKQAGARGGKAPPTNATGFHKAHATGSLINDLRIGRLDGYMHNPMAKAGKEADTNTPSHLPSQDHHKDAHGHMDKARKAKTTDEKRSHVFNALTSLNKAKKYGQ